MRRGRAGTKMGGQVRRWESRRGDKSKGGGKKVGEVDAERVSGQMSVEREGEERGEERAKEKEVSEEWE